jgi:hypothetical protein
MKETSQCAHAPIGAGLAQGGCHHFKKKAFSGGKKEYQM